jgi:HlyD family secretion protein
MTRSLLVFAVLLASCGCRRDSGEPGPEPVQVHCVRPARGAIDETLSLRGRVEPPPGNSLSVASQVPGRVVRLIAREGQHIGAGEIVAIVDGVSARDGLRQADAAAAQAKVAAANADATLARIRALVARGIAARQELEDAQAKADTAHAGVEASAATSDLAKRTLGRVQVRSTLAGVVTRVLRGAGALVDGTAATPIVELASSAALEFVGVATQADLGRLRPGQAATGEIFGAETKVTGAVRMLPSALDPVTGLGVVRIALEPGPVLNLVGAYGRMFVTTRQHDKALLLPAGALRGAVSDGAEVIVCKDGKAHVRGIGVGIHDSKNVEVLSGLDENETVALDHVLGLDEGTPVREVR